MAVAIHASDPIGAKVDVYFEDVAKPSGISFHQVSGGPAKDYILESVGGGVGFLDYDHDGWLDIYLVNGGTFETLDNPKVPRTHTNKLFRNNGEGAFIDVTEKAGVSGRDWGMGVALADFNNDGYRDLYVTNFGANVLYQNNGNGTFSDVTRKAGVAAGGWSTGAAWGDYDLDGDLDLYVARYVDFDRTRIPPKGSTKFCQYRGLAVQCGPRGLKGHSDVLFRNNGDGTFADVTQKALGPNIPEYYGFTPLWCDLNNDGWPDLYVANDGTPNLLYLNRGNGTFEEVAALSGSAYSRDGLEQASMGADFGDYDNDGWFDIFITNFSDDYNTLYRNLGKATFKDATEDARIVTVSWKYLGWAAKFFDFDLDGWLDLFVTNGHVYPEVDQWQMDPGYKQNPQLLRNQRNGTFSEVTRQVGSELLKRQSGRGAAFGDVDNDGDLDIVINNIDGVPSLLRCISPPERQWIILDLYGIRSNRDAIGTRIKLRAGGMEQIREVHPGGGFLSSNDFRAHFGLGASNVVDEIEIKWPAGTTQIFKKVRARQFLKIKEGSEQILPYEPSQRSKLTTSL
jgi:hypothetical protein